MLLALLIAVAGLGTLPDAVAASADETSPLQVTKSGPSNAAPGDTVTYRVKLENTGSNTLYNVLLADLLPAGETYQANSTKVDSPYAFGNPSTYAVTETTGEPAQTTETGQTLLVWPNELDLAAGQSIQLEYTVTLGADVETGSTVTNSLQAFASSNPRTIPEVDTSKVTAGAIDQSALGSAITNSDLSSDVAEQATTLSSVTLLKDKSSATSDEPASGGTAWLRGVHENKREVPLTVKNSGTSEVSYQLVDFLPAAFEFLDGTSTSTESEPEWADGTDGQTQADSTGAGTSSSVTTDPTSPAATAAVASVETLVATAEDAAKYGVTEGSTYTKITWNVTVPAQSTATVTYWAGIPLQENTTDWNGEDSGEGTAPTGTAQASNLDNNSGTYTRDLVGESRTNVAALVAADDSVVVTDSQIYTIADAVESKSVVNESGNAVDAPNTRIGQDAAWDFRPGQITYFSLTTTLSEYVGADAGDGTTPSIVITDELPDGMQPIAQADGDAVDQALDAAFGASGALSSISDQRYSGTKSLVTTTDPTTDPALTLEYTSATFDSATGKWTITLEPTSSTQDLVRGETVTVRIPVYQQTEYSGADDSRLGQDIVAYDQFTNSASATVQTEAGVDEETTGVKELTATDSADLQAITPTIDKRVLSRDATSDFTTKFGAGTLTATDESAFADSTSTTFEQGDLVWFKISFDLADPTLSLRDTQLTDFLPQGSKLYGWTFATDNTAPTDNWTATGDDTKAVGAGSVVADQNITSTLVWKAGDTYQELSGTENRKLSVIVGVELTQSGASLDNLAKASVTNTKAAVVTFRDEAAFEVDEAPSVALIKDVVGIGSGSCTAGSVISDGAQVTSGQCVTYKVTATNTGAQTVLDPTIWDVLPTGFTNGAVYSNSSLSSAVTTNSDSDPDSTLKWAHSGTIAAGASVTYYVTATAPADPEVNTTFTNTAGVRDFATELDYDGSDADTDLDQTTWYPAENIDSSVVDSNASKAKDTATVKSPNVSLSKTVTSGLSQNNNNQASNPDTNGYGPSAQAVVGEKVTFKITLTVPANTTVTGGSLKDAVANAASTYPQITIDPNTITVTKDSSAITTPLFTGTSSTDFTWGQDFSNTTDADVTYVLTVPGTVTGYSPVTNGSSKNVTTSAKNTATFTSKNNSGISRTATVQIVNPNLTASKTASPDTSIGAGQTVTFTVKGTNQSTNSGVNTPGLKSAKLVDTLPGGLTYTGVGTVTLGSSTLTENTDYTVVTSNIGTGGATSTDAGSPSTVTIQLKPGVVVAAGQTLSATLTVTTPDPVTASATYDNSVSFEGDSLTADEATAQSGTAQHYATTASKQITVNGATSDKAITSVSPSADGTGLTDASGNITTDTSSSTAKVTPGQTVTYQVSGTIPANTETFDTTIVDTLPAGAEFVSATITGPAGALNIGSGDSDVTQIVNGQTIGWAVGHVAAAATEQTYTVTVQVRFTADLNGSTNSAVVAGKTLTNTAQTKWNLSDKTDPTDPTASLDKSSSTSQASVTVVEPKVTLGKTVSSSQVELGSTVTFALTATNTGTSTAYDFVGTDTLPEQFDASTLKFYNGATQVTDLSSLGVTVDTATRTITWNAGDIAVGTANAKTLTFTVVFGADSSKIADDSDDSTTGLSAKYTNTFTGTYSSLDGDDTDASYERDYTPTPATADVQAKLPHLSLTKTPTSGVAYRGQNYTWTLTATNSGQGTANDVQVLDRLPDQWSYVSTGTVTVAGSAVDASTISTPSSGDTGRLTWSATSGSGWTLASGQSISIQVTAKPAEDAALSTYTNTLGVSLTDANGSQTNASAGTNGGTSSTWGTDSSYADEDATADVTLQSADLQVAKTAQGDWTPGQTFGGDGSAPSWLVTVTNKQSSSAAAVGPFTLTDLADLSGLTAGTVTAAQVSGWTVTAPDGSTGSISGSGTDSDPYLVTWGSATPTLAQGASFTVRIPVTVDAAAVGTAKNTATATAQTADPTPSDNTDTAEKTLAPVADLGISKTTSAPTSGVKAGQSVTWTITVTNHGPSRSVASSAAPITVTDALPDALDLTKDVTLTWQGDSAGTLTRDAAAVTAQITQSLDAGQSVSFTVTGTLKSSSTGTVENTATVTPGTTPEDATGGAGTQPNQDTASDAIDTTTTLQAGKDFAQGTTQLTAGSTGTYRLSVTNTGTADAVNVTLDDTLPSELTYQSWSAVTGGGTWTFAQDGANARHLTWTLSGSLAPGETRSVEVTVLVAADVAASTTITNTVTADADNAEPDDSGKNSDSDAKADLSIAKTHSGNAIAGQDLTYTLTVTNNGPSVVPVGKTITVADTLPAGLTYVSSEGAGWTVSQGADDAQALTWTSTSGLAVNATSTIQVTVHLDTELQGAVDNTATVDGPTDLPDPDPSNNSSTDPATVISSADVTIDKTVTSFDPSRDGKPVAGGQVTYTLKVTNNGPSTARNVTVTDPSITGLQITSISGGSDWTLTGGTLTYTGNGGLLEPGVGVASDITVTGTIAADYAAGLAADASKALVNTANLGWDDSSGPHTDSDDASVDVVADADLQIVKTAVDESGQEISSVTAGTSLRYQLQVKNNGLSDADGPVTIIDTLPAGTTYVSFADTTGTWTLAGSPAVSVDGTTTLAFTSASGLGAGQSAPVLVIATEVAADAYLTSATTAGTETHALTNTATVSSNTPDTDTTNNTDDATVDVTEQADLSVTKTHEASAVHIGDTLPFTITVTNHGPSAARGVTVKETLPAGLTFVGLQTPAEGQSSAWQLIGDPVTNEDGTTTVEFELVTDAGTLSPGVTAPELKLDTAVAVGSYPRVVNSVDVASDTPEADIPDGQDDPYPNHADDPVDVPSLATLGVTKTHEGELKIGQKAVYVITVTNSGPTEDTGAVTVTDELPQGLTYRSADQSGVSVSGQTVTWLPDAPIGVGESRTLRLTVSVGEAAGDHVVNTVTVTSDAEQTPDAVLTASDAADVAAADPLARTGLEFSILLSGFLLLVGGAAVTMLRDAGRSRGRRAR